MRDFPFSLIIVGLMGVLPFLQWKHYYPITDFYTEWVAAIVGLCALLFNFRRLASLPLIALAPLSLVLIVWLQYAMGMMAYTQQALMISAYLIWAALIAMLAHALKNEFGIGKVAEVLAWFILAGGMLNACAALIQHYHVHAPFAAFVTPDSEGTVYGNLAQQNHFSDYMSLSLASLLYLFARSRIPLFAAVSFGIIQLFTLALSGSRSAWLYLAAMALLAVLHSRKERNRALLYGAALLIPAFIAMQFAAHLAIFSSGGALTSGDRLFFIGRDSGIRLYLWREAWLMFLKSPILGVGFGQFAWHHFGYGPLLKDPQITGLYSNSHDIAFNLLAETGLSGFLVVFGGLFFWARRMTLPFDIHAWWLYSLLLILALHSLDEYPLWYAHFLGLFMLLLGLGEERAFRLPFAPAIVAFLLVLGGYLTMGLMRDYRDLEGLLYPGYHSGRPPLKPAKLFDALSHFRKGTLLAPYVEYPMAEMISIDGTQLKWKLGLTARAVHFSPEGMVGYQYAAFLALDGRKHAAEIEFERSASSDPDLVEDALELYSGLAEKHPDEFGPLVKEVGRKLKEQKSAFHHQ